MDKQNKIQFEMEDVNITSSLNKMYIVGCIATVGTPSSGAPGGLGGMKALITEEAGNKCVSSFKGTPLNCLYSSFYGRDNFTGHMFNFDDYHEGYTFGFIEDAWIESGKIMAKMVVWKDTYPELAEAIILARKSLGFSIEADLLDFVPDETTMICTVNSFEGTGCALLYQDTAAFGEATYIDKLVASLYKKGKGDVEMTKEEMKELAGMIGETVDTKLKEAGIDVMKASIEDLKTKVNEPKADEGVADIKASLEGMVKDNMSLSEQLKEVKAGLDVFKTIPKPKAQANEDLQSEAKRGTFRDKIAKIEANDRLSTYEKMKEKSRIMLEAEKEHVNVNKTKPLVSFCGR